MSGHGVYQDNCDMIVDARHPHRIYFTPFRDKSPVATAFMSQRQIKFRAWDKIENVMFAPTDMFLCSDGKTWAVDNDGRYGKSHHQNREDVALMQFTGLCDRNGEEIYEADVITGSVANRILRAPVIWIKACWCLGHLGGEITALDSVENPEILGNTYENPELVPLK
jgi:YopX protein